MITPNTIDLGFDGDPNGEEYRAIIRRRILARCVPPTVTRVPYEVLVTTERLVEFEQDVFKDHDTDLKREFVSYSRNRLIMGALRYGRLNEPNKSKYNRAVSMTRRWEAYKQDHNLEHLVDIYNEAGLEYTRPLYRPDELYGHTVEYDGHCLSFFLSRLDVTPESRKGWLGCVGMACYFEFAGPMFPDAAFSSVDDGPVHTTV